MNEWEILEHQVRTLQGADFEPEPPPRSYSDEWPAVLFVIIVVLATLAGIIAAWPHDALPSTTQPLGWTYDYSCCSAFDCRSVGTAAVAETPQGYVVKLTGELVPYGDKRIKRSKDEFYHQCTIGGDPKATHSICLYVPDRGL